MRDLFFLLGKCSALHAGCPMKHGTTHHELTNRWQPRSTACENYSMFPRVVRSWGALLAKGHPATALVGPSPNYCPTLHTPAPTPTTPSAPTPTLLALRRYELTAFQSGLVVSMSLLGALLGSLIALATGNKLGRRTELIMASVLYGERGSEGKRDRSSEGLGRQPHETLQDQQHNAAGCPPSAYHCCSLAIAVIQVSRM